MIDISWVMRDSSYFTKEMLQDYILNNVGGSSLTFLEFVTGLKPAKLLKFTLMEKQMDGKYFRLVSKRIHDSFHSRGGSREPALVYGFKVDKRFQSGGEGSNCHTGHGLVFDEANAVDAGDNMVSHSMLLIGSRYCYRRGDYMFSLQNGGRDSS
jgi:hypothetical protein